LKTIDAATAAIRRSKDPALEGMALRLRAQIAKERKDLPRAQKLLAEALELFKGLQDPYQLAITHGT
jgi:hypothetical protein